MPPPDPNQISEELAVDAGLSGRPVTVAQLSATIKTALGFAFASIAALTVQVANLSGGGGNTSIRATLTTAGLSIPTGVQLVRLTQTSPVTNATITLPPSPIDAQPLEIDNYVGQVTSTTFSPSIVGWADGATFAAPSAVRARWDAGDSRWHRTQ